MMNTAVKITLAGAALMLAVSTAAFGQSAPTPVPLATSPSVPTVPISLPQPGPLATP
jgi:hypothetical protein